MILRRSNALWLSGCTDAGAFGEPMDVGSSRAAPLLAQGTSSGGTSKYSKEKFSETHRAEAKVLDGATGFEKADVEHSWDSELSETEGANSFLPVGNIDTYQLFSGVDAGSRPAVDSSFVQLPVDAPASALQPKGAAAANLSNSDVEFSAGCIVLRFDGNVLPAQPPPQYSSADEEDDLGGGAPAGHTHQAK
jgi:hypothetical protein